MLAFRLARPAVLVDLNRVEGLDRLELAGETAPRIGAMTRHRALEQLPGLSTRCPMITEAMERSVTSRFATGGRSGAAWLTPIRRRSAPRSCSCSMPSLNCARAEGAER